MTMDANASDGAIVGGLVLLPDADDATPATVTWRDGLIDRIGPADLDVSGLPVINAAGALVLPGIIDVHGDAFERCLMPRGGVAMNVDLALRDNDTQLLAAGITTSFLSATDSWEPGLRSRETLRTIVGALGRRVGGPDVLLHVRHERCNTEDFDELVGWVESGAVRMLSFNDHTLGHGGDRTSSKGPVSVTAVVRSGVSNDELEKLQEAAADRREVGRAQERDLAAVAAVAGCVTASHDANSEEHLARDLDLGVAIAEFPTSIELAKRYQQEQIPVLLGAPNLVRGGSHLSNLAVGDALAVGVGDLLCSDYHYPSLLQAPFVASESGLRTLGEAWNLVASTPARASGLDDRGRVAEGCRADLLVVQPPRADGAPARVERAVVAGALSGAAFPFGVPA